MTHVDLRLVDELCLQMRQYADTIEKLIAGKKCQTAEIAFNLAEIVFETRKQLTELLSLRNKECLGVNRIATIVNLVRRYESLEGTLKEIRNDIKQEAIFPNLTKGSLQ